MSKLTPEDEALDLHLISLEAEHVKRLRVARIAPDGSPLFVVGGRNAQGKSSLLDSIMMALNGGDSIPDEPVQHGADQARIRLDLGDLIVERKIRPDRKGSLVVSSPDGVPVRSPQALLDRLVSKLALDPVAFAMAKPDAQRRELLAALGLAEAFERLAVHCKGVYDARTLVGRDLTAKQAQLKAAPPHDKAAPATEVSMAELLAELERRDAAKAELEALFDMAEEAGGVVTEKREWLEESRKQLAELEGRVLALRDAIGLRSAELATAELVHANARAAADAYTYDDPAEVRAKLATVEETNAKVRANAARAELEASIKALQAKVDKHTRELAEAEDAKRLALEGADFPIAGLEVTDEAVRLNGAPLKQASQRQKVELGFALCAAQKPKIRIALIREGSFFDSAGMQTLAEVAAKYGFLALVERVSEDGAGCNVVIEDGEIASEE